MNFTCEPLVSEVLGVVDATRIRSLVYAKHTFHSSATTGPVAYTPVFTVLGNDSEAWHAETTVFTMILKPGMQKQ